MAEYYEQLNAGKTYREANRDYAPHGRSRSC